MADYPVNIQMEEAADLLQSRVWPVSTENIPIGQALGRVLAEDILAQENLPPFDRSPYDGYAVRSADLADASPEHPAVLAIVEEVPAGQTPRGALKEGQAVKLLTGSPIPAGADAVIKYEDTKFTQAQAAFYHPCAPGSNIVRSGEDLNRGDLAYSAGDVLSPAALGLLAGLGCSSLCVYRKPRAAIISTGDELVPVEEALSPGKIRNSSAYLLAGFLSQWGIETELYGIVGDDENAISRAVEDVRRRSDFVITTGGASVGDYDLVCRALDQISARMLFWKVRMKPGMATLAAVREDTPILGLSGNPSAAAAALFCVGRPALAKLCGRRIQQYSRISVCLSEDFPKGSPAGRILPGSLEFSGGRVYLNTSRRQANGRIQPWEGCRLLGILPPGTGPLLAGSVIEALYLEGF